MPGQPDVYHDISEVVWKDQAAQTYLNVLSILQNQEILHDPIISELNISFINTFNSNHSRDNFCLRTSVIRNKLTQHLNGLGYEEASSEISGKIDESIEKLSKHIHNNNDFTAELLQNEQTHINDGSIYIAGEKMEEFASRENYLITILRLFGDKKGMYKKEAEIGFSNGFNLSLKEKEIVRRAKRENWDIVDMVTQLLLKHQIDNNSVSVQNYEFIPSNNGQDEDKKTGESIEQAFYFMGKSIASIALYSSTYNQKTLKYKTGDDPIKAFLLFSKDNVTEQQIAAVKKVALAHCSHGLNSGELTAQLASSVRTSFPRALIASLNVRSGLVHAGAVTECMIQTKEFLNSNKKPSLYVKEILSKKDKLYGFGHRIHKTSKLDSVELLGKDPRVSWYINATQSGFPEKSDLINQLISYAQAIRVSRPDLGANTDFGAAVLFNCLELPPQVASGFFMAFRIPGLCARIVNELNVKSNARRPPFPIVLPYPRTLK